MFSKKTAYALMPAELPDYKTNTKVKYYPNGTFIITCFNYPAYCDSKNYELMTYPEADDPVCVPWPGVHTHEIETTKNNIINILDKLKKERNYSETIRSDSIKRTKEKVFDIAFANADNFTHFITFTLNKEKIDRYDKDEILKKFTKWLNHQTERKNAHYVIVPEYHKDGAVHFHGLIGGDFKFVSSGTYNIPDVKKPVKLDTLYKHGYKLDDECIQEVFNLTDFPFGYSTAIKLYDDKLYICKYITKYICKGSIRVFGNFYFAGGKGLVRELPTEYLYHDFQDCGGLVYKVPNTNYKVKYMVVGEL